MAQNHCAPGGDTAGPATTARTGHGGGRLVLVLEDEPNISEAIRFILRRDGWNVLSRADGLDVLDLIAAEAPSLLILDVMLPGRSGLDILQAIRARPELADLPVIVLTAKGQAADRDHAMRLGASLYMAKPFANAELLAAVRQLVGV
jgi:DNA-binding response OmpR family regulator